jgi:hypothetical protein
VLQAACLALSTNCVLKTRTLFEDHQRNQSTVAICAATDGDKGGSTIPGLFQKAVRPPLSCSVMLIRNRFGVSGAQSDEPRRATTPEGINGDREHHRSRLARIAAGAPRPIEIGDTVAQNGRPSNHRSISQPSKQMQHQRPPGQERSGFEEHPQTPGVHG